MQPGIKVKLPASQISELRPQSGIFIVISEQEKIYLQDKEVDIEGLEKGLKAQLEDEVRPVVIRADKNVRHGKVVEVMDVVKLSGAERLLIATSPRVVDEKDLLE
jgi:biopolymer transport protein ExbD